jgi:predicted transcriptional regulator
VDERYISIESHSKYWRTNHYRPIPHFLLDRLIQVINEVAEVIQAPSTCQSRDYGTLRIVCRRNKFNLRMTAQVE